MRLFSRDFFKLNIIVIEANPNIETLHILEVINLVDSLYRYVFLPFILSNFSLNSFDEYSFPRKPLVELFPQSHTPLFPLSNTQIILDFLSERKLKKFSNDDLQPLILGSRNITRQVQQFKLKHF